jgi:hypothetical protein
MTEKRIPLNSGLAENGISQYKGSNVIFFQQEAGETNMDVRLRGASCGGRRQRTKGGPVCRSAGLKQRLKERQA